jgi:hypothetical protein
MELYVKNHSLRKYLNKLVRITQRVEVTQLQTKTVTVKNVYKNKQIIEVVGYVGNRFNNKI